MGIHYDYKSTRGAKKIQKQQEREQRRKKKRLPRPQSNQATVPEDVVITLDILTKPK